MNSPKAVLLSNDPQVVEWVLAAASAASTQVETVSDPESIRRHWRVAPVLLVGADTASSLAEQGLPVRPDVHLVGPRWQELAAWSVPLAAPVLVLPAQSGMLSSVLERRHDVSGGRGGLVRVWGASGGLGVSTLTCWLAHAAHRRGLSAAAVELDPAGAGLDLIFGAEQSAGWRWADLASAAGHIDGLSGRLPNVNGVEVVAHRGVAEVGAEAQRAIVAALSRSHDLVVADCGRSASSVGDQWLNTRTLLVVGADLAGVSAARRCTSRLQLVDAQLVLRRSRQHTLPTAAVQEALGMRCVAEVNDDPAVAQLAITGAPPGAARARRYRRQVDQLLREVLPDDRRAA